MIFTFLPNDQTFFKYIAPEWDILCEVKVTQLQGKQDLGLKQDMNLFLDRAKKTQGCRSAEQGSDVGQASLGFPSLSRPVTQKHARATDRQSSGNRSKVKIFSSELPARK